MATQRIREFSEGVQYVLGDVALYNDAASSTTIVKRCKKNTPIGEFQPNDWEDIFSFPTSKKSLQGVINTAERITTQTLLYGERMSRVTAIPHLIPQTKMVKVMQALEKRAPRSTENIGGKEYKIATNGKVYYSRDRKTTDGKDIVDVGYFPLLGRSYVGTTGGAMSVSIKHILELTDCKSKIISADLPFIQSVNWYSTLYDSENYTNMSDVYGEKHDYSTKALPKSGQTNITTLIMDEQKPFARVFANPYRNTTNEYTAIDNRYSTSPMFMLEKNTDSLVACGQLPLFLKKYNIAPQNGYITTKKNSEDIISYSMGIYSDFIGKFDIYDKILFSLCPSTEKGLEVSQEQKSDVSIYNQWKSMYNAYNEWVLGINYGSSARIFDGWVKLAFAMK